MAEFFISYTQSDSQWAHWIALDLHAMGHIAHVHEWEVGPGEDIVAWLACTTTRPTTCSVSFQMRNGAMRRLAAGRTCKTRSTLARSARCDGCAGSLSFHRRTRVPSLPSDAGVLWRPWYA